MEVEKEFSSSIEVEEEASFSTSIQVGEVEVEEEAPGLRNLDPVEVEEEASSSEIVPTPSCLPDGKDGFRLPRGWPADFRGSDEVRKISPPCSLLSLLLDPKLTLSSSLLQLARVLEGILPPSCRPDGKDGLPLGWPAVFDEVRRISPPCSRTDPPPENPGASTGLPDFEVRGWSIDEPGLLGTYGDDPGPPPAC